jgi:hypothetical protein
MPGIYEAQIPLRDLARMDKIINTKAHDAKFFSALQKPSTIAQLDYSWQLAARKRTGHRGAKDGEDQTTFDSQRRIAAKMRCMELRDAWHVSQKTDDTEQIAGPEKAVQKAESSIRLKEKIQARCLSDAVPYQEAGAEEDAFGGVFWWFFSGVSDYYTLPEAYRVSSACLYQAALADFSEKDFEAMIAQAFKDRNGGEITLDGWVGIDLKNRFNDFSAYDTDNNLGNNLRQYTYDQKAKTVMRCVDFLIMSEGLVRLHPTTYLLRDRDTGDSHADAHRSGVFLDMNEWYFRFNVPFRHKDNTDEGGGPRGHWKSTGVLHPGTVVGQLAIRCNA